MRVYCAAQALKESLPVSAVKLALESGIKAGGSEIGKSITLSDGGDGFLDAVLALGDAELFSVEATDPTGKRITSYLGADADGACYIEMARASGLALVPMENRNIWAASTAGTGDLLYESLRRSPTEVYIGLGGSATNDGGIGMLAALSDHYGLTSIGKPLSLADLECARTIPLVELRRAVSETKLTACTDVKSLLLGKAGSAYVFAPQKGATPADVPALEQSMVEWAAHVESTLGNSYKETPGAGAAGGLGFALAAIGASLQSGAEMFLQKTSFFSNVVPGDVIISTEGRFDYSSMAGKAPWAVCTGGLTFKARPFIICGSADPAAVAEAQGAGVTVVSFGGAASSERRTAESPGAISECVRKITRQLREA